MELNSMTGESSPYRQRRTLRSALLVSLSAHLVSFVAISMGIHTTLEWDIFPSLAMGLLLGYVLVTAVTILLCVAGVLMSIRRQSTLNTFGRSTPRTLRPRTADL